MLNQTSAYADYKEKQEHLLGIMNEAGILVEDMGFNQKNYIKELCRKLENDSFKVQVIGTFKNGKSTFINSILGDEVLPAYASPCTAVINEVKYGEEKRAVLHFRNPLPSEIPSSIPQKARDHIIKYDGTNVPPIEIPENEIEDYAVIPMGKDPKEMMMESPYDKIELFWPLELLKNNVEVIDSPGLNEHATRTKVTMGYLSKADAILFVLSADKLCARDEMEFIEKNMKNHGFDSVFFVINRFDLLRKERDKQAIVELAKVKLSEYTRFGEDGLYFISALDALDGKIDNDMTLLEKSGMPVLEERLAKFLTEDRGSVKLSQPASELKRLIDDEILKKELPQKLSALNSSLADIMDRRDKAIPALQNLKKNRDDLEIHIDKLIESAMCDIAPSLPAFFEDLNTSIPQWLETYEPTNSISLNPLKTKESASVVVTELVEYVQERLEEEQNEWLENTFSPLITSKLENIQTSIKASVEGFYGELDKIKIEFSGIDDSEATKNEVPVWQRVAAAGTGLFVSGYAGATLGGMEGFSKDFVKGIAMQVAMYFGISLIMPLTLPVVIITALGSAIFSQVKQGSKIMDKIKEQVAEQVRISVNEANLASKGSMTEEIKKIFYNYRNAVLEVHDTEIENAQSEVNGIVAEIQKGQSNIDKKKDDIAVSVQKLQQIGKIAEDYIIS